MLSQFSISSILVSRKSYTETRKLILLLRVNYENNVVQKNLTSANKSIFDMCLFIQIQK